MSATTFSISVREFVDFAYRTGDLGGDGRILSSKRAVEGTRGHRKLQQSRGDDYQAEVSVEHATERDGVTLRIVGRIDGLLETTTPPTIEEIKTVDSRWSGEPDPLHRAQVRTYAAILCGQRGWTRAETRLTYYHLDTEQESTFSDAEDAPSLASFLAATLDRWFEWLIPREQWRAVRNASIHALEFPLGGFRPGQRTFAAQVYRTIRDSGQLFAEAPTGTGKTLATLFPATKALPLIDGQVFYVTAKTPGRHAAEEALDQLRAAGARLRSISLTAKRKICFNAGATGCDLRTCPYALGYYDRCKPAVRDLLTHERIDREAIESVARSHTVCPFELSLDASNWTDFVIGDFNYVFDPTARLVRHFENADRRHVVLIDEAHNLVDRSRAMYSASLSAADLDLTGERMTGNGANRAHGAFRAAIRALDTVLDDAGPSDLPARDYHADATAHTTSPDELIAVLRDSAGAIERFLTEQPDGADLSPWLEPFFAILTFLRAADGFDETCRTILEPGEKRVTLFCADASARLAATLTGLRAAVFFSATLAPSAYFRQLLGGTDTDPVLALESSFRGEQMPVTVLAHDVTYRNRNASRDAVSQAVIAHLSAHPGNHLVFTPSFAYLDELSDRLDAANIEHLTQTSGMDEPAREAFLGAFANAGNTVGLAVLGGIFSEGIDLPGDRIVGVTVIGIGLPRLSLERDILRRHFEQAHGQGFDYAYRFPGMQRVLQAVGRLIRSETDQGAALLIDHRFREARTRVLLPRWWQVDATNRSAASGR